MTRKDYILIAAAIHPVTTASHLSGEEVSGARRVAERIAAALAEENPRFDKGRFLAALGVNP